MVKGVNKTTIFIHRSHNDERMSKNCDYCGGKRRVLEGLEVPGGA